MLLVHDIILIMQWDMFLNGTSLHKSLSYYHRHAYNKNTVRKDVKCCHLPVHCAVYTLLLILWDQREYSEKSEINDWFRRIFYSVLDIFIFYYLNPILINISLWIDCLFEIRKIAVCFLWLPLPGHLQGHWWGFSSRNYVVWPIFFLMNVFIALKRTFFYFYLPCWCRIEIGKKCKRQLVNSDRVRTNL